jgi:sec-independent protein translocase protein TatA
MFGISFEHILIVGVILIFVGPRRLPELGNTMGKALKNFKDSISGIEEASYKKVDAQKIEAQKAEAQRAEAAAAAATLARENATANSGAASTHHHTTVDGLNVATDDSSASDKKPI